jgi:uncharacterized protein (DUF58 family)
MIDRMLQQVRRIPLRLRRPAYQTRLGQHQSQRRGASLEFDQIKEYQVGESIRKINWAATARRGAELPLVNVYYEDKDITVMLLVDLSASMDFGSIRVTKKTLAAEIAASLVYSALTAHDRVGLVGFTSRLACALPPQQCWAYQRAIPEQILTCAAEQAPVNFWAAVHHVERWVRSPALVFLFSDFLIDDFQPLDQALARLYRRHELIVLSLTDPLEVTLPTAPTSMVARDLETGQVRTYCQTRRNQQRMAVQEQARRERLQALCRRLGVAHLTLTPHSNYREALSRLFLTSHKRASA